MSFLDELKKDAVQARREDEEKQARLDALQSIYRDELRPKLLAIHHYLQDVVEQLESVAWKVEAEFNFPGIGKVGDLQQEDYRLNIDSTESPKEVSLSLFCRAPETAKHACDPACSNELQEFLHHQKVRSVSWPQRLPGGKNFVIFEAKLAVVSSLRFRADIERSCIELDIVNLKDVSVEHLQFAHDTIADEAWLNKFGGVVLRKIDTLASASKLSQEERAKLEAQLKDIQKRRLSAEREVKVAQQTHQSTDASDRVRVLEKLEVKLKERLAE